MPATKENTDVPQLIAAVRVKGRTHVRVKTSDTLRMLNLTRVNHCSLVFDKMKFKGMLHMAKDYITWGELSENTLMRLLKERARIVGDKPLTDAYVKENSKFGSVKSLAEALFKGDARLNDVKGLKKLFRLSPPKKGYERKGIKLPYSTHGALGYRRDKINDLIERMI
ncbi:MAG: 50S ribosomal protein L30 [Candidatus Altiarchaeota archaeon]|nr:50S ribosomal protein L30 [Candidatus Altiarchaeota archaeon]